MSAKTIYYSSEARNAIIDGVNMQAAKTGDLAGTLTDTANRLAEEAGSLHSLLGTLRAQQAA